MSSLRRNYNTYVICQSLGKDDRVFDPVHGYQTHISVTHDHLSKKIRTVVCVNCEVLSMNSDLGDLVTRLISPDFSFCELM